MFSKTNCYRPLFKEEKITLEKKGEDRMGGVRNERSKTIGRVHLCVRLTGATVSERGGSLQSHRVNSVGLESRNIGKADGGRNKRNAIIIAIKRFG